MGRRIEIEPYGITEPREWFAYVNAKLARDFTVAGIVAAIAGALIGTAFMLGLQHIGEYLVTR